ncbi:hypothetical protein TNIN_408351 [Trichonephila inaurata madagascariensis]|uniref:Uncharacterized protein n=1 Tax=Trichonephila inaurata madagascariensis TaxID=2747483 RepID=A0A8X6WSL8_9ARAC|nr:hypothetical protein TNIN_408351 [Trichonephila inaurata madagascariensis]
MQLAPRLSYSLQLQRLLAEGHTGAPAWRQGGAGGGRRLSEFVTRPARCSAAGAKFQGGFMSGTLVRGRYAGQTSRTLEQRTAGGRGLTVVPFLYRGATERGLVHLRAE